MPGWCMPVVDAGFSHAKLGRVFVSVPRWNGPHATPGVGSDAGDESTDLDCAGYFGDCGSESEDNASDALCRRTHGGGVASDGSGYREGVHLLMLMIVCSLQVLEI